MKYSRQNNICKYNSGKCASLMDMSRERELCRIRCACNRRTAFNLKHLAYGWVGGQKKRQEVETTRTVISQCDKKEGRLRMDVLEADNR